MNRQQIEQLIVATARKHGIDPNALRAKVAIESGFNPGVKTGSYKGLLQLSDREFAKHGGKGDIFNPQANLDAGASMLKAHMSDFERQHGRAPQPWELYMVHQQGAGGYAAHASDPTRPAWQSMASTGEGRQKGAGWAKQAIWGNLPNSAKKQFGSVDNVTSGDFLNWWKGRYGRASGAPAPAPQPEGINDVEEAPGGRMAFSQDGMEGIGVEQPSTQPMPTNPQADGSATPDINDPSFWQQILDFEGVNLAGLLGGGAVSAPSVKMVQAPAPRRNVDMSGINSMLKGRGPKFGR